MINHALIYLDSHSFDDTDTKMAQPLHAVADRCIQVPSFLCRALRDTGLVDVQSVGAILNRMACIFSRRLATVCPGAVSERCVPGK